MRSLPACCPGRSGQLAVFVATRLNAPPDALAAWMRAITELKHSRFVLAIGRFSDMPRLSDLDALTLDQGDLEAIQRCRPGDCGLKLSAEEIESLTAAVAAAGSGWRDAVQQAFRRLLVERVQRYRTGGLALLPPPADGKKLRKPDEALQVDMRRGFFGAFARGVLEDRVERQAPLIVRGVRARLESGNPPDEASDPFVTTRLGVH